MVVHIFNSGSSGEEAKESRSCEFQDSMVYTVNSKLARYSMRPYKKNSKKENIIK